MALLEVGELHKSFGDIHAVAGVSFRVEPGEIFGLIGPDGAGKTSTLRMIVGLSDPEIGRAHV